MSQSIYELVDNLPKGGLTVMLLNSLNFAIPGQWDNLVGFENTIKKVTGETDPDLIQQVGDRAVWLFNDKSQGYQNALWLYQTVDATDKALGAAALANKVGENISFLSFLNKITPNPNKAQAIDLSIKLVAELIAFCQINGIPGDSIGDFVASLGDYSGESLTRMAALVCFDGIIPLGPDFVLSATDFLEKLTPKELEDNKTFNRIKPLIPGNNSRSQLDFVGQSFGSVTGWMTDFVGSHDITPEKILGKLRGFMEVTDDKLDYLAAFIDMSTNYYEHTGIQTLAHRLIERAVAEI
ncbi:MAG: hypothetical protein VKJ27_06375 [Synechocystis sp.]|nr:hypothetical protein [Synechocystis sp.]